MNRKFAKLATAALLAGAVAAPQAAFAAAPAPILHNDNTTGNAGDWYHGATPPNVDYNKPVVLFVQGLHSNYGTWVRSDGSGFYDAAYNAGFRTAFVQLKDADGGGGNMWTNGPILANVIQKVKAHYGVSKINIVAHSKGGIDTNAALIHYGAASSVNVVHQVATPNKGSEIADLAYGSWTWWLGALLGQQDDAVYSLQTSYMANFRAQSDGSSANGLTRTYMSAGTGDDGIFSATWTAHPFLPDEDDGAVAYYSAVGHPHGVFSFKDNGTERLSHGNMVLGAKTWKYVQPKLTTASFAAVAPGTTAGKADLLIPELKTVSEESSKILRGGAVNGQVTDSFQLESKLGGVTVDVMTAQEGTTVKLVSPSGAEYLPVKQAGQPEGGLFEKATHNLFQIANPEKGEWKVLLEGEQDGYFLAAHLEGGVKANVKANQKVLSKSAKTVDVTVGLQGSKVVLGKAGAKLVRATEKGKVQKLANVDIRVDAQGQALATIAAPTEPGVYNLSFDVIGVNEKGEEFTRSVNYNFAVTDEFGKL